PLGGFQDAGIPAPVSGRDGGRSRSARARRRVRGLWRVMSSSATRVAVIGGRIARVRPGVAAVVRGGIARARGLVRGGVSWAGGGARGVVGWFLVPLSPTGALTLPVIARHRKTVPDPDVRTPGPA
ncbi:MAG: hypothetical protein ACRDUA_09855, partial [Micromonosporaceae bacterium]